MFTSSHNLGSSSCRFSSMIKAGNGSLEGVLIFDLFNISSIVVGSKSVSIVPQNEEVSISGLPATLGKFS